MIDRWIVEPNKFHHASYNFLSTKIPESLRHSISRKPIIYFPVSIYHRSHPKQPTQYQYIVGFAQALNAIVTLGLIVSADRITFR
jgi:hypothetical protein